MGSVARGLDAAAQRRRRALLLAFGRLARTLGRGRAGRRSGLGRLGGGRLLLLAETAAGGFLGAGAGVFLGLVTGVFLGLAAVGLGLLLGGALGFGGAAGGGIDGRLALLGLVRLGIGQGAGAGVDLLGGKLAQHQAGAGAGVGVVALAVGLLAGARRAAAALALLALRGLRLRLRLGLLLAFARQDDAALLAFDRHRVGAAMREALPDGIPFDATLQAERALGGADRLVVSRFAHAFLSSCTQGTGVFKGIELPAAGAMRSPVTTKPVKIANPCQQIGARRPGKQRSMYHICSAKSQIQIGASQRPDDRQAVLAEAAAGRRIELCRAVGRGFRRVDQPDDRVAGKRRLDLGEAGDQGAGLAGERQGADRGVREAAPRPGRRGPARHGPARRRRGRTGPCARPGRHARRRR